MLHQTAALALVTAGLVGCATAAPTPDETSVAAVQAVYIEVASDIYVSARLLAAPPAQDYWVKVVLPAGRGQDITTMARVPATLVLAAGDTVSVALEPVLTRDDTVTVKRPTRVLDLISTGTLAQASTPPLPAAIERLLTTDGN